MPFDVLDPNLDIMKSTFLEASAGTGKTFAIEHLVKRLLLEKNGPKLSEILILTFTKAATAELKTRIFQTIKKEPSLKQATLLFDEAKIFTIHGFCFHCLEENALDFHLSLEPKEESASPSLARALVKDYILSHLDLHPIEIERLLKYDFIDEIAHLHARRVEIAGGRPFMEIFKDFKACLGTFKVTYEELLHFATFFTDMSTQKKEIKKEVADGLKAFSSLFEAPFSEYEFPFSSPVLKMKKGNFLKKITSPQIPTLELIQKEVIPLLEEAQNDHLLLARVARATKEGLKEVLEKEELFFYEDLLVAMEKKVQDVAFAQKIRSCYGAVFIDEFQDTDKRQWTILNTLFAKDKFKGPVFLIGDPKQSIYRFRNSDLYTYLEAKKTFDENAIASLDVNYRATPSLVQGLNELFTSIKEFLYLPKTKESYSCPPVKPSFQEPLTKAVHFCVASDERTLFAKVTHELCKYPLSNTAVLVKDRNQAQRFLEFCQEKMIPALSKRCRTLFDSCALDILYETLDATLDPQNKSKIAQALGSPLFNFDENEVAAIDEKWFVYFADLHETLATKGVIPFFQKLPLCEKTLYSDLRQLVAELAQNVSAIDGYLPYLNELKQEPIDSERIKLHFVTEPHALQIMTIHASKGLEFDIVCPLGLILDSQNKKELCFDSESQTLCFSEKIFEEHVEELEAEKMRLLYVAMTRAKKHLYVPVLEGKKKSSPMTVFLEKLLQGKPLEEFVRSSAVMDFCEDDKPLLTIQKAEEKELVLPKPPSFKRILMTSFSSLAPEKAPTHIIKPDDLPSGPAFGNFVHKLFEQISFQCKALDIYPLIEKSPYAPWKEAIADLIYKALNTPLPFTLSKTPPHKMIKEMEFCYPKGNDFIKGFIDLVFEYEGKIFLLDWKTNILENYEPESIACSMKENFYFMQAEIYEEALQRYMKLFDSKTSFGGYYYFFIRGLVTYNK